MQNVFDEVNSLDKRCYEEFSLSEDILMEHAALGIKNYIIENFSKENSILIVSGVGNNGADGIALARLLFKEYKNVKLFIPFGVKSSMAKLQLKRLELLGFDVAKEISKSDIVVDCLFGSGLNKPLDEKSQNLISKLNSLEAFKIACDIPSGINNKGQIESVAFYSDLTFTMGAYKKSLFTDIAKEFVGKIKVCDLGIPKEIYENESETKILEKSDLKLPLRDKRNTHKGTYGHLNVVVGSKSGAGIIAANAGFCFGAGLVSVVSHEKISLPEHIMSSHFVTGNCTAIAIGMGLGQYEQKDLYDILSLDIKKIVDADLFYEPMLVNFLDKEIVLTPHPKEFISLLTLCDIANIDIKILQENRFYYLKEFCSKYPNVTIVLKGANTLIAKGEDIYINPFGSAVLSKGGSGDVLSGLIGSLLAQGYSYLDSAINASLAHSLAGCNYKSNNYSLTPQKLIEELTNL